MKIKALLCLMVLLATCAGFAAAPTTVPPTGTSLLPPGLDALQLGGKNATDARLTRVEAPGQPFKEALRLETLQRPPYPWNITLAAATTGEIHKGDVLLAGVTARRIASRQETGEALLELIVEENEPEHHKLVELATSVGPGWTAIQAPFVADKDYPAGGAQLSLRVGYSPQTIEVTAAGLTNYGNRATVSQLPRTRSRYAGWEPDAPWRTQAADRIEKIRKGELRVQVVDADGKPVPDAKVSARMVRHAFAFGSAVQAGRIAGTGDADNERYRETIEKYFNKVVFENELKWPRWETNRAGWQQRRTNVFAAIDWLNARHIDIRGHVLTWPSWENTPGWLREFGAQPDKLRAAIDAHITGEVEALKGNLKEWDVINESYAHNDVIKVLGREEMARWFKLARQSDPGPTLFYNDYIMFSGSGEGSPSQYLFDTIRFLQQHDAPIGGLGEQGHFGGSPPSPEKVLTTFDRFRELGLPIQISEFDIDTSDEEMKVHYTRDFMTACFSHPAVTGVMMWGFWEGAHWRPRAALWNKDWSLRPNGQVWLDLVTREWWTNAEGATDPRGEFSARAFYGDYRVTVESAGRKAVKEFRIRKQEPGLRVQLN